MVRSKVRIKNKIKAKFRQHGVLCTGDTVYAISHREEWRNKLPGEPGLLLVVDELWQEIDQFEKSGKKILAAAKEQSRQYPEIKLFKALPGIDFINAATISAILETPWRFTDKRKVWMYAGLGVEKRESGEKVYSKKLTKNYNRLLKYTVKQAAEAAIRAKDNPFRRKYLRMTLIQGVVPHRAKLTVARDILAVLLAMWKKGERYNSEIREKNFTRQNWT
jgi:transposase